MGIIRELNHKRIELGREIVFRFLSFFERRKMAKQNCELENYKTVGIVFIGHQIGDSLIMTSILRPLKESGYKIVVFCYEKTNSVIKNSQYIDKIIVSNKVSGFKNMRALKIDLLIDISTRSIRKSHRLVLKRKIQPKYSINFYNHFELNKGPSMRELTAMHNEAIIYEANNRHSTYIYKTILSRLGIEVVGELDYEFNLDDSSVQHAKKIINNFGNKIVIIFNPYANVPHRSMSEEQTLEMLSYFNELKDFKTILIGEAYKITKLPAFDNVYSHIGDLNSAIALLSMSDLVVTVETSIVHFSRCFNKKMIAIYANFVVGNNNANITFAPFYDNAIQLFSPTKENKDFDVNILKNKINQELGKCK